jgi:hypothetical protein
MTADQLREFEKRFDPLSFEDQLLLVEHLVRRVRRGAFLDEEACGRQMEEMAKDAELLKALGMDNGPAQGHRNAAG